jgi:excinuclease UvrABC nuclease subunit
MRQAAAELNFEDAAKYRDRMSEVLRMISESAGGHA